MQRALQLASQGQGNVSPNPMVGCVIVCDDQIIGEGFHQKFGGPHAEVNAINAVKDKELLSNSDVYVTLEPCSHFGKTPPCADLLITHQVKRVFIASLDPNPKVSGRGVKKLEQAGIEVHSGLLDEEAKELNKRFFTFHIHKRPYILLKWAQTEDGFVARENFDSKWISNPYARQLVHKTRSIESGILVGFNTVHYDNPSLTTRDWAGQNPVRLIIDPADELDKGFIVFNDEARQIIFNEVKDAEKGNTKWVKYKKDSFFRVFSETLHHENLLSVLVEGGSNTLQNFIDEGFWDEAMVFTSKARFEKGIPAPVILKEPKEYLDVVDDNLSIYRNDSFGKPE